MSRNFVAVKTKSLCAFARIAARSLYEPNLLARRFYLFVFGNKIFVRFAFSLGVGSHRGISVLGLGLHRRIVIFHRRKPVLILSG